MRPLDRLSVAPDSAVLAHEAGHLVIGLELALHEGGIEFLMTPGTEVARAHYNGTGATNRKRIVRAFAGMYVQAILEPNSISDKLRASILNISLVEDYGDDVARRCIPADIVTHGFQGDWIDSMLLAEIADKQSPSRVARNCLVRLRRIVNSGGLVPIASLVAKNAQTWLATDDPDVSFSHTLIYPVQRAREIFASWRQRLVGQ